MPSVSVVDEGPEAALITTTPIAISATATPMITNGLPRDVLTRRTWVGISFGPTPFSVLAAAGTIAPLDARFAFSPSAPRAANASRSISPRAHARKRSAVGIASTHRIAATNNVIAPT